MIILQWVVAVFLLPHHLKVHVVGVLVIDGVDHEAVSANLVEQDKACQHQGTLHLAWYTYPRDFRPLVS